MRQPFAERETEPIIPLVVPLVVVDLGDRPADVCEADTVRCIPVACIVDPDDVQSSMDIATCVDPESVGKTRCAIACQVAAAPLDLPEDV